MFADLFHYEFLRNAVIAAVLASTACGLIGTYVVVKRIAAISGGIAHTAFGGIGLGYFLGLNPVFVAIPFSICSAVGIGWLSRHSDLAEDTAIGIFWAAGMAVGILFIGLTPGYAPDLMSYLFGNILAVPGRDIWLMAGLVGLIILTVYLYYPKLLAITFDEEYARAAGLKVTALYFLLLGLVALTVVLLIRIVGVILVIALLTIPAAMAKQYTSRMTRMMALAVVFGGVQTLAGLWLAYHWNLASGATIILLAVVSYFISWIINRLWIRPAGSL